MKRYLGTESGPSERHYEEIAGRYHPALTHLVEVYDRDGRDVRFEATWHGYPETFGELWVVDEPGHDEITAAEWEFQILESTGFSQDELARLERDGEL